MIPLDVVQEVLPAAAFLSTRPTAAFPDICLPFHEILGNQFLVRNLGLFLVSIGRHSTRSGNVEREGARERERERLELELKAETAPTELGNTVLAPRINLGN